MYTYTWNVCVQVVFTSVNVCVQVVFTAGLQEYASHIIDQLDRHRLIAHRLYRQHTRRIRGHVIKDLAALNRPLARTVIVDNR